ncbi:PD-(D/E)XK nuclease family protein [Planktomarina sp.]|nr:PD-(D/E)XK nuclease family protein [Planktomarina sp.]
MFYPFDVSDIHSDVHYQLNATRLAELSLAPIETDFLLGKTLAASPDPVWAGSLENAPIETIAAIAASLKNVMLGTTNLRPKNIDKLPEGRAKRHLTALNTLWLKLGDAMPEGLGTTRHVLELPHGEFWAAVPVVEGSLDPLAAPAMKALYLRLEAEFGSVPSKITSKVQPHNLLSTLQAGLTRTDMRQIGRDTSISVFGLRDPAACTEFAAARARSLIGDGIPANQIAVLTMSDPQILARAFDSQGVPLSGLPGNLPTRDTVGETLYSLLLAKRPQTPAMVLASLCLSPMMPWAAHTGRDLAEAVMEGRFRGQILDSKPEHRALWDDIRRPATSVSQLNLLLRRICDQLPKGQDLRDRLPVLLGEGPPNWDALLRAVEINAQSVSDPIRTLEGVSIWSASDVPWRPCSHLLITDFSEGHYPTRPGANALFLDSEVEQISAMTGLHLRGRTEGLAHSITLFEAQLGAVADSVTFLIPWRDMAGTRMAPSAGLSLIARAVSGIFDPVDLIVDVSQTEPHKWPIDSHTAAELPKSQPVPLSLHFDQQDLLALRLDDNGAALPQSPSRLETLVVSPLAWLLGEIGAGDMSWQPETLDIMIKGNIAHEVFEYAFLPDVNIPDEATLLTLLPEVFDNALRHNAAFLRASTWELERVALEKEIVAAALRWRSDLVALGANILGNETWLYGDAHGIRIRGRADTILRLPDGQIVIVDYKKSGTPARRKRMEKGWDLQAGLYKDMLAHPLRCEGDGLDPIIGNPIGIAYHLMNDGGILTSGVALDSAASASDMGPDVNIHAIEQLTTRLAQAGGGEVRLNTTADHNFFRKEAGFTPYALQYSPIITAFMREGDQ